MTAIKINAVRLGPAETMPVLMLHGWGQSHESLRPLGELVASMREVHLLDLPGFGASTLPPETWNTADYAAAIAGYIRENGINKACLLGHSFGGKVALRFAADFPQLTDKLVLIGASGLKRRRSFANRVKIQTINSLRTAVRLTDRLIKTDLYREWFIPHYASPDYKNAGPLLKVFVRVVNEDLTGIVQKIEAPALLIWGTEDCETPVEIGKRLEAMLAHAQLVQLEGKGHFPFTGPGAHLCFYHIKPFLE